jgi:hypothetical protein
MSGRQIAKRAEFLPPWVESGFRDAEKENIRTQSVFACTFSLFGVKSLIASAQGG